MITLLITLARKTRKEVASYRFILFHVRVQIIQLPKNHMQFYDYLSPDMHMCV